MLKDKLSISRANLAFMQLGLVAVFALIFLAVVSPVRQAVREKQMQLSNAQSRVDQIERETKWLNESADALKEEQWRLISLENQMAPSEMYFWMIKRVRDIAPNSLAIHVEPPQVEDGQLHFKVPYSVAVFPLRGMGSYQQIGKFVADLENSGSFFVVQKLSIKKIENEVGVAEDKLEFRLQLATPMRPSTKPVIEPPAVKTVALGK